MIRINLLPFRAARKKENIKRQITTYALTVAFLLTIMSYYFLKLNSELSNLKEEENRVRAELKTYEKTIKRITQLEKKIKEIRTKLNVIKTLIKNKTGPVHLLDEISKAVPKDKVWLNSFQESKGILRLQGTATDNKTVALFMINLEKSKYIQSVDLQKSQLAVMQGMNLSNFSLQCKTYAFKKPAPKGKKKKK